MDWGLSVLTEEQETKARVFFCGTMKTHFDNNGSISPIGVKSPSGMVSSTPKTFIDRSCWLAYRGFFLIATRKWGRKMWSKLQAVQQMAGSMYLTKYQSYDSELAAVSIAMDQGRGEWRHRSRTDGRHSVEEMGIAKLLDASFFFYQSMKTKYKF